MGSKKDKLKQAARNQLQKATEESAGMRRLVNDIVEDRSESADVPTPTPPAAAPAQSPSEAYPAERAAVPDKQRSSEERKVIPERGPPANYGASVERAAAGRPRESHAERVSMARTRDSVYNVSSDIRLEDYTDAPSGNGGRIGRIVAAVVLALLLLWGVSKVWGWIFAPGYTLAIAGTEITETNMQSFAKTDVVSFGAGQPMVHIRFQWKEGELATDLVRIRADQVMGSSYSEVTSLSRRVPITVNYVYFASQLEPGRYRIQVSDREGKVLRERTFRVQ